MTTETPDAPTAQAASAERYLAGMRRLLVAVQELSMAKRLIDIQIIVRKAARELTGCDGATFVLRDGDRCHYADEDAYQRWLDFVPADHIGELGMADNFWAMGDTGPCGGTGASLTCSHWRFPGRPCWR